VSGPGAAQAGALIGRLEAQAVVPVVRTATARQAEQAVQWLHDAGLRTFEITMTIPDAVSVIRALAGQDDVLVGAGTVLDAGHARACAAAGARFLVSPAVSRGIVATCVEHGLACLLGAGTPTEVLAALDAGADAVKIFPVSSFGGVAHVKALRSVFPAVRFCPTGGIGVGEIGAYLAAGAAFVGVGGKLVDAAAIARGDRGLILEAAREARAQVAAARG
jgi:2-dehydro-3-deoxyphosphogluconate aldolase/(4S)-4-hydroxy-2-oxoglutarate aldolase